MLALAVLGAALFLAWPRAVWLVDEAFQSQWERVLQSVEPPRRIRVTASPQGLPPRNRYGFIISARGPLERADAEALAEARAEAGADGGEAPQKSIVVYRNLAASRQHGDALLLALDPWMMFKDFKDPAVSRARVDAPGGGEGILIVPGRDADSRWAWAAQLLQSRSGIFPEDGAVWKTTVDNLFWDNSRFQPGAETYGWMDAMPLLYRSSPAWVYAPLSRIRSQSYQDTSGLDASRYPEPDNWNEFGIQAAMLWALPFGRERDLAKLGDIRAWLTSAKTQTAIADALRWIPALPEGVSYNTVSRAARLAYLSSSFIWTFY